MLEMEKQNKQQKIELEREFEARLAEAISKASADQAAKEKILLEDAEQAKAKALDEI